jgi:hypothetical protein
VAGESPDDGRGRIAEKDQTQYTLPPLVKTVKIECVILAEGK